MTDHSGTRRSADAQNGDGSRALKCRPRKLTRSTAVRVTAGCWMLLALPGVLAQSGPTLIAVGTTLSTPGHLAEVAPGDMVTLQVMGLKTVLPAPVRATSFPLPTELAGISVLFSRANIPPGRPLEPLEAVPLFSIEQTKFCDSPPPDCTITSITIQVPHLTDRGDYPQAAVVISEAGAPGKTFWVGVNPVDIRVLTTCSRDADGFCGAQVPSVTHADGTLVTAASPAKPGEVVVIYATVLGFTNPRVLPGQAAPSPAQAADYYFALQFDFNPNARPRYPDRNPITPPFAPRPEFVGLTPGQVGLYQINVKVPDSIPPVPPCRVDALAGVSVVSNLTISVIATQARYNNLDGAAICVTPPQ